MGAKRKLNSAAALGALGVAALIGAVTASWAAFWLALAILVTAAIHDGSIRIGRGGR